MDVADQHAVPRARASGDRRLNFKGRVVLCGGISQYNSVTRKGPANYLTLLTQRARMEGFIVFDYQARYPEGTACVSRRAERTGARALTVAATTGRCPDAHQRRRSC